MLTAFAYFIGLPQIIGACSYYVRWIVIDSGEIETL
jgi:hypothetical protein